MITRPVDISENQLMSHVIKWQTWQNFEGESILEQTKAIWTRVFNLSVRLSPRRRVCVGGSISLSSVPFKFDSLPSKPCFSLKSIVEFMLSLSKPQHVGYLRGRFWAHRWHHQVSPHQFHFFADVTQLYVNLKTNSDVDACLARSRVNAVSWIIIVSCS